METELLNRFGSILRVLADHKVRFILVGGVAAIAHGAGRMTEDVDIVYERSEENLRRLVTALEPLSPYLRGAPADLPFRWHFETLHRGLNFTLTTDYGSLDLLGEITGGGTYDNLLEEAIYLDIFSIRCACLGLAKLIDVKRAAGRPKDFEAIAELEAILDESVS